MLRIIRSMKELDFAGLMEVYIEGNRENGADHYPGETQSRQMFLAEQDFHQYLRECFFPTEGAFYAVWQQSGKYVSALRMEPYRDGLLLAALETAPEQRCRGYACDLIRATFAQLKDVKVYAHVSKGNIPSLKTHQKCGFRRILEYAVYADGSVMSSSCTMYYEI